MTQGQASSARGSAGATLRRLLAADGTGAHPYIVALSAPRSSARDLGDAVHALCAVHGHHPDLLSIAAQTEAEPARAWLHAAAEAFSHERGALTKLVAAAGPLPSTPGQAETAAALGAIRHALGMLARSERTGVALGAAAALVDDWLAVRGVLTGAAGRFGIELHDAVLPAPDTLLDAAPERALAFGAQQLLAQHRGLWSLLEARSSARARH